jgi:hypothetical protein
MYSNASFSSGIIIIGIEEFTFSIPSFNRLMISSAVLPLKFLSQRMMISSKLLADISPNSRMSSSLLSPVPEITPMRIG